MSANVKRLINYLSKYTHRKLNYVVSFNAYTRIKYTTL